MKDQNFMFLMAFLILCGLMLIGGSRGCSDSNSSNQQIYTKVEIQKLAILYSSGEDGDRFYRAWTNNGIFDMRDGFILGWRAGEMYGQLREGMVCDLKVRSGWFVCGKYKCITRIIRCSFPPRR